MKLFVYTTWNMLPKSPRTSCSHCSKTCSLPLHLPSVWAYNMCVYVCVCVCVCVRVRTCDETLPVLLTEIKFQKDQKYTRQSC